ncbi:T9SS type A sorting domain-containing protein [bacterium]|nr:T9SS type A sorting domain-containing protein [bacterium]
MSRKPEDGLMVEQSPFDSNILSNKNLDYFTEISKLLNRGENMKNLIFLILIIVTLTVSAYETDNYQVTFIDSSRDDREISTKIYYPVIENKESAREETFPKFIFGHGWLMSPANYTQLAEFYSSEGFIVALPYSESGLLPDHNEFALDLIFLVNALDFENSNENSPIYNLVSEEAIVSGHSMGGGASLLAASQSNVFDGVVNFAAAETSPSVIGLAENIQIPTLLFAGANDTITPPSSNQEPMYQNISSNYKCLVTLSNESHLGITDNDTAYELSLPFIRYALTNNDENKNEFESLLYVYSTSNQITYLLYSDPVSNYNDIINLEQINISNSPNPFNPATSISFKFDNLEVETSIEIYNIKGQKIRSMTIPEQKSNFYNLTWDATDQNNQAVSSGIYLYRLISSQGKVLGKAKMMLIK